MASTVMALHWRRAAGAVISLGGLMVLLNEAGALPDLPERARGALAGGAVAALATAAGTLPVLLAQNFSQRVYDAFLGLGAGIMLAATAFSLVLPAIAASKDGGYAPLPASLLVACAILLGMGLVILLDRLARPERMLKSAPDGSSASTLKRAWLFVAAVTIHNLPEGLAIGVAYAGVDAANAYSLATGIAIQDIPEGLVVALALRTVGYGRRFSAGLGVVSGLIEPVAAVAGALLIDISVGLLPWGLGLAAGAMLFVICHDVIPEGHRNGNASSTSCAVVAGFIIMMVLDTALA
jgi:ZIP family zinc transporter